MCNWWDWKSHFSTVPAEWCRKALPSDCVGLKWQCSGAEVIMTLRPPCPPPTPGPHRPLTWWPSGLVTITIYFRLLFLKWECPWTTQSNKVLTSPDDNVRKNCFEWLLRASALHLATTWPLYPTSCFSDHYGRYLLQKKQILRSLNPRSLFMYWRRSVTALLVAKPSAAALSKVAKPSGHCITTSRHRCNKCWFGSTAIPVKSTACCSSSWGQKQVPNCVCNEKNGFFGNLPRFKVTTTWIHLRFFIPVTLLSQERSASSKTVLSCWGKSFLSSEKSDTPNWPCNKKENH